MSSVLYTLRKRPFENFVIFLYIVPTALPWICFKLSFLLPFEYYLWILLYDHFSVRKHGIAIWNFRYFVTVTAAARFRLLFFFTVLSIKFELPEFRISYHFLQCGLITKSRYISAEKNYHHFECNSHNLRHFKLL